MAEKRWKCQNCGNKLESDLQPQQCPCGEEDLEAQEQLSMLEQMMRDFLSGGDENKKAKS